MPVKDERNPILLNTQPVITLPSGWVKFWKIKKKVHLSIIYDSILVVMPLDLPNRKQLEKKDMEDF